MTISTSVTRLVPFLTKVFKDIIAQTSRCSAVSFHNLKSSCISLLNQIYSFIRDLRKVFVIRQEHIQNILLMLLLRPYHKLHSHIIPAILIGITHYFGFEHGTYRRNILQQSVFILQSQTSPMDSRRCDYHSTGPYPDRLQQKRLQIL